MEKIKSYSVELYSKFYPLRFRKEWRWRVTASNGRVIGASTESYVNKSDCIYNIKSLGLSLLNFEDRQRLVE